MPANVVNPFEITPELTTQHKTATQRAQTADEMLTGFINEVNTQQEQTAARLSEVVETKKAVNTQVLEATQDLQTTVAPLFQRRVAIADQRARVAEMNPFVREFRGIFDRNYREEHLDELDQAVGQQLQAHGQQYQSLMGIHDTVLKVAESNFAADTAISDLIIQNGEQDIQLAMQSYGSAQQLFTNSLQGLEANNAVIRAQALAAGDLLSGMSPQEVNQALTESRKNGGQVAINGVVLRTGELQDAAMGWQEKQLALESRQIAIQSQRMDLASQYEAKLISHMTGPEIESAIAAGGVYKGQRLNQTMLTQALGSHMQRRELTAAAATQQSAIPVAQQLLRGVGASAKANSARAANLFGMVPRELEAQNIAIASRMAAFTAGVRKANESGAGAEYVASQLPAIQQMAAEQSKLLETMATRWAGGDKDMAEVGKAWLTGSAISSPAAVRGLISMARNGVPAGTKLSPAAQQVVNQVKARVAQFDAGGAGMTPEQMFLRGTGKRDEYDPELIRGVTQMMTQQYVGKSMEAALSVAPQIAQNITGPDGKPHPFSRVTPQDFQTAVAAGDEEGYRILGQRLGMNGEQAKALFASGPNGQAFREYAAKNKDADFGALAKALQTSQSAAMLSALDQTGSARNGFKPSAAFTDLLRNPQYQQMTMNAIAGQQQSNAGDYLIGQVAGTQFDSTFHNWTNNVQQGYAALQQQSLVQAVQSAARLRNVRPWDAANITMGTIDGLNEAEQRRLMDAVARSYASVHNASPENAPADSIDSIITRQRFADPELERMRQIAAKEWMDRRPQIYRGLSGFLSAAHDTPADRFWGPQ